MDSIQPIDVDGHNCIYSLAISLVAYVLTAYPLLFANYFLPTIPPVALLANGFNRFH